MIFKTIFAEKGPTARRTLSNISVCSARWRHQTFIKLIYASMVFDMPLTFITWYAVTSGSASTRQIQNRLIVIGIFVVHIS